MRTFRIPAEWSVSGIYCIQNNITGKRYIGSSIDVKRRLSEHRSDLRSGKHANPYLQASFNSHGEAEFTFSLVEKVDRPNLASREKYWIDYYDSFISNNGYNVEAPYRGPVLEETKAKISAANKGKVRTPEMRKAASDLRKGQAAWNRGLTKDDPRLEKCIRKPGAFHHTEETKKKISINRTGIKPKVVPRGYKLSQEVKDNMSQGKRNFYQLEENRKAHSERMKQWWAERKKINE